MFDSSFKTLPVLIEMGYNPTSRRAEQGATGTSLKVEEENSSRRGTLTASRCAFPREERERFYVYCPVFYLYKAGFYIRSGRPFVREYRGGNEPKS
mmetsp:Transcript_23764/g.34164  ORF Transcript_23764/g.34164 Transcript_23764/m.34164 type:complete len:96 (+) Transcript_23764:210-497(+)